MVNSGSGSGSVQPASVANSMTPLHRTIQIKVMKLGSSLTSLDVLT